eukprot:gene1413-2172_t
MVPPLASEFGSPPISPERATTASTSVELPAGSAQCDPSDGGSAPRPRPAPGRQEILGFMKSLLQGAYNRGALTKSEFVAIAKASLADALADPGFAARGWRSRAAGVVRWFVKDQKPELWAHDLFEDRVAPDPPEKLHDCRPGPGCSWTKEEAAHQRARRERDLKKASVDRMHAAGSTSRSPTRLPRESSPASAHGLHSPRPNTYQALHASKPANQQPTPPQRSASPARPPLQQVAAPPPGNARGFSPAARSDPFPYPAPPPHQPHPAAEGKHPRRLPAADGRRGSPPLFDAAPPVQPWTRIDSHDELYHQLQQQQQQRSQANEMLPVDWVPGWATGLAAKQSNRAPESATDEGLSRDALEMMNSRLARLEQLSRKLLSAQPRQAEVFLHELRSYHFYATVAASSPPAADAPQTATPCPLLLTKCLRALEADARGLVEECEAESRQRLGLLLLRGTRAAAPEAAERAEKTGKTEKAADAEKKAEQTEKAETCSYPWRGAPDVRSPAKPAPSYSGGLQACPQEDDLLRRARLAAGLRRASAPAAAAEEEDVFTASPFRPPALSFAAASDAPRPVPGTAAGGGGLSADLGWAGLPAAPFHPPALSFAAAPPPAGDLPHAFPGTAAGGSLATDLGWAGQRSPSPRRVSSAEPRRAAASGGREASAPPKHDVVEYIRSLLQPLYNSGAMSQALLLDVVRSVSASLFSRSWELEGDAWKVFIRTSIEELVVAG